MNQRIVIEVNSDNREDWATAVALTSIGVDQPMMTAQGRFAISNTTGREFYFFWRLEDADETPGD